MIKYLLASLFLAISVSATRVHVTKAGNNTTGTGATNAPWLTVTFAESQMATGDSCYIGPGTYEEAPTVNISGTVANRISFIGQSGTILRGIHLSGASYVSVIGIEFTQVDSTYGNAPVSMAGTSVGNHWIDNYIHNTYTQETLSGIHSTGTQRDCVFRGNLMFYLGSVNSEGRLTGINTDFSTSPPLRMVAEYNTMTRMNDYITLYGGTNIIRNNFLGDHIDTYWVNNGSYHADHFQATSDGAQVGAKHHIYERNFSLTNFCMGGSEGTHNGHFLLLQDSGGFGDTNHMARGNIVARFSDGAIGGRNMPSHTSTYDNTFYLITNSVFLAYNSPSTSLMFVNSIISTFSGPSGQAIDLLNGATGPIFNNVGYLAGTETAGYYTSTSDPQFVNPSTYDFRLQSSSPARALGTNIVWITGADGSGTTIAVNDPQLLSDGWGIVEGDLITTGGTTVRIVTNNWANSNIVVSSSVTWTNLQPVFWGRFATKDVGALPFGAVMLTSATLSQAGTVHTVTPIGDARGVWFYTNGVPANWDYDAPYQYTSSESVTAKAYAEWAQSTPVVNATFVVSATGAIATGAPIFSGGAIVR